MQEPLLQLGSLLDLIRPPQDHEKAGDLLTKGTLLDAIIMKVKIPSESDPL